MGIRNVRIYLDNQIYYEGLFDLDIVPKYSNDIANMFLGFEGELGKSLQGYCTVNFTQLDYDNHSFDEHDKYFRGNLNEGSLCNSKVNTDDNYDHHIKIYSDDIMILTGGCRRKLLTRNNYIDYDRKQSYRIPIINQFKGVLLNYYNSHANDITSYNISTVIENENPIPIERFMHAGILYKEGAQHKIGSFVSNGYEVKSASTGLAFNNNVVKYNYKRGLLEFIVNDEVHWYFSGTFNPIFVALRDWTTGHKNHNVDISLHSFNGEFGVKEEKNFKEFSASVKPYRDDGYSSRDIIKDIFRLQYQEKKVNTKGGNIVLTNERLENSSISLDNLIGLNSVKNQFEEFKHKVTYLKRLKDSGKKVEKPNLHMIFTGAPGTGKTTVARIVGKTLYQLGLLSKGHFIEVDRSKLVGEYIGQTAKNVAEILCKAKGGVLFIDEAYSLHVEEGTKDFGNEAISTIIKSMEDNRDDLVVIFAGYKNKMDKFLGNNEGLRSRITYYLNFEDYDEMERMHILESMCKNEGYEISNEILTMAGDAMAECAKKLDNPKDEEYGFANARGVRNFFDYMKDSIAIRIQTSKSPISNDNLQKFIGEDVVNAKKKMQGRIVVELEEQPKSKIGFSVNAE
jgi:stage V sporulation protein K